MSSRFLPRLAGYGDNTEEGYEPTYPFGLHVGSHVRLAAAVMCAGILLGIVPPVIAQAQPGKVLRGKGVLLQIDNTRLEGRVIAESDTALSIQTDKATAARDVQLSSIDSLWVRGSGATTGAVVGGLLAGGG